MQAIMLENYRVCTDLNLCKWRSTAVLGFAIWRRAVF